MPNIPDELSQFIDLTISQRAREAYTAACAHLDTLRGAAAEAEAKHAAALAARRTLAQRFGIGEAVSPKDITTADAAVNDAAARVTFTKEAMEAAENRCAELDRELVAGHGLAHVALLDHGIDLRIAAAGRLGEATVAMQAAEAAYSEATEICRHAFANGVPAASPNHRMAAAGQFPRCASAEAEAAFWGVPVPEAAP